MHDVCLYFEQGLLYAQQEYEEKLNQVKKEKDNMFEELQALVSSRE